MKALYKLTLLMSVLLISQLTLAQCNGNIQVVGNLNQNKYTFIFNHTLVASYSYLWNYGDGTSDSGNPNVIGAATRQFQDDGTYMVTVIYTDSTNGCTDYDTVMINDACDSHFTMVDSNDRLFCTIDTNAATYNNYWYFSHFGSGTRIDNPSMPYYSSGTIYVSYQVRDTINNCYSARLDTVTVTHQVKPNQIVGESKTAVFVADTGIAYLIVHDSVQGTLTAIDSVGFGPYSYSHYKFSNIPTGDYLLKFALDSSSYYYSSYLPTYFNYPSGGSNIGSILWSDADYITIPNNSTTTTFYNLTMVAGNNPGGPGFVGGLISQGANKVGDPIPNINVLILDVNGDPVSFATSDEQGKFMVDSLPLGTYSVYPEVAGKTTTPMIITLTSQNPGTELISVEVNSTTIEVSLISGIKNVETPSKIRVFPNPVINHFTVDFGELIQGETVITVLDASGKEISRTIVNSVINVEIQSETWRSGIYIVKIQTPEEEVAFKVTK